MSIMSTSAQEVGSDHGSMVSDSLSRADSSLGHVDLPNALSLWLGGRAVGLPSRSAAPRTTPEAPDAIALQLSGILLDHYVTLKEGIRNTNLGRYARADSLFLSVAILAPDHPVGPLMRASTLQAEMIDLEVLNRVAEFQDLLDTAETRALGWIQKHPDDAWGYCYLGHTHGYRAMWQGQFGSWIKAVKFGLKAKNAYHDAIKRDSLCWDAYLGLGSYHYWKSAKTEFINWTGFIVKDQKKLGREQTSLALAHGIFSRAAAAAGLIQIYRHQKEYDRAISLAREWQALYPEGKTFLWGQAYAEFEARNNDSALVRFDTLHARVAGDSLQGWYNLIEIDYHRGLLYDRLGEADRACAIMDSVVGYPVVGVDRERQKDKLKQAGKFLRKTCRSD